jgi:hypothetical protein
VVRWYHEQTTPATVWPIIHNLGARPSVVVVKSVGGVYLPAKVIDISDNQTNIELVTAREGVAILKF